MVDSTNFKTKADSCVAQAEKKLKGKQWVFNWVKGGFFKNMMQSKEDRMDEAKELFQQAANCYKLCKDYERAVTALLRCIECSPGQDSEQAGFYLEAAHCIKNVSTHQFIEYSRTAIDKFCLVARISSAAGLAKECAEKLDEEHDYEDAIKFYERAAELYQADEQPSQANSLLVKASDLIVLTRDYKKLKLAVKNYEKVGKKYLATPMIKTSAKDLFFKSALCYLADDDMIGAKRAIQNYQIDDPNFDSSRENDLLMNLIEAVEAKSEEDFIKIVSGYVKITPLDKVKNQLVAKIKEIYVPDKKTQGVGKIMNKLDRVDLTGADDFLNEPSKKEESKKTKKQPDFNVDDDDGEQQYTGLSKDQPQYKPQFNDEDQEDDIPLPKKKPGKKPPVDLC